MNERSFSRRRKGPMRFKPSGGLGTPKPVQGIVQARADAISDKPVVEEVFDVQRHRKEIERSENIAAGLPPETGIQPDHHEEHIDPNDPKAPATIIKEEPEEKFKPVPVPDAPAANLVDSIRAAASKVIRKVQRMIRPQKDRIHKEVIINAESLETRVAVLEDGKLEDFTIERTGDDRLVGSIFKGKVKNLEDGLKAAFVDIGFEKNAFLHYWDIVPVPFDSGVEVVERETRRRDKPRITQKDIPRLYPPNSEIIVQVTKGPIGSKGPRVTTNLALPGRYLVLLPNSDQSGISRKIENPEERQRLKKIVRELT
ncbi:MAG: ribonuclease E/G, partial [Verrucomicrobiales bacterium]